MSIQADKQRSARQKMAAPGGRLDRLVRAMRVLLPSIIGCLLAILIVTPFSQRQERSFLLAKDEVSRAKERMRVTGALYRGEDGKHRPFSIAAQSAIQRRSDDPSLALNGMRANILLDKGPASAVAGSASFDLKGDNVKVAGPLSLTAPGYSAVAQNALLSLKSRTMRSFGQFSFSADGRFRLTANDVMLRLNERILESFGPVSGSMAMGTFSGGRLFVDADARVVRLTNGAHLRINQNAIR